MIEPDDRLAGDLVWELFPAQSPEPETSRARLLHGLEVAFLVVFTWFLYQPLAVVIVCLTFSLKDFRDGWRLARSIPDQAGGTICALFSCSWGAWKIGISAFTAFCVLGALNIALLKEKGMFPGAFTAMLLVPSGFFASTVLTATGLIQVLRSGMRVWIGEGMNQARTLLLGMLIIGFMIFVIGPILVWLTGIAPRASDASANIPLVGIAIFGTLLGGAIGIMFLLDWACRKVLAEQPGKFGPKVPTVGKWGR